MVPRVTRVPERTWLVTDRGREAIECAALCVCDVKLIGILFACPDCGTVMGSVKDAMKPRAQRWTAYKR